MNKMPPHARRLKEMEVLLQFALDSKATRGKEMGKSKAPVPAANSPRRSRPSEPRSQLENDLKAVLHMDDDDPFSISRLSDKTGQELSFLEHCSFEHSLLDRHTSLAHLGVLKDLGKWLSLPVFPHDLRLLGRAVYFCSVAAARVFLDTALGSMKPADFREGVEALDRTGQMPIKLMALCWEAIRKIDAAGNAQPEPNLAG